MIRYGWLKASPSPCHFQYHHPPSHSSHIYKYVRRAIIHCSFPKGSMLNSFLFQATAHTIDKFAASPPGSLPSVPGITSARTANASQDAPLPKTPASSRMPPCVRPSRVSSAAPPIKNAAKTNALTRSRNQILANSAPPCATTSTEQAAAATTRRNASTASAQPTISVFLKPRAASLQPVYSAAVSIRHAGRTDASAATIRMRACQRKRYVTISMVLNAVRPIRSAMLVFVHPSKMG